MAYAYQQRSSSQQPPRGRYDYSDADDEMRGPAYQVPYGYNDSGRVFGQRDWPDNSRGYHDNSRNADNRDGNGQLAPYYNDDSQRRRSSSRMRSRSRGRHLSYSHSQHHLDRDNDRSADGSSHRNRSRSRFREFEHEARGALDKTFDSRGKGIGAGVVGALVGGAIGRRFGDKHDNHALAGAIIGGLGMNIIENRVHRSREAKREEASFYGDEGRRRHRSR